MLRRGGRRALIQLRGRANKVSTPLISLYSGTGGLDLGFVRAGFSPIFANDVDRFAAFNYSALMASAGIVLPSRHFRLGDISDDYSVIGRHEDAVLVGGPPCQGFSRAGRMDPEDPRSQHVRRFLDAVAAVRPRAFVMENVRSLALDAKWRLVRDDILRRADNLGYASKILVMNAADHGVPQTRHRMFLVGITANEASEGTMQALDDAPLITPRTIRSALSSISHFEEQEVWQHCRARIVPASNPVTRASPFAGMLFNGQGRPLNLESVAPTLSASLGGNHTPIIDQAWLDDPSEAGTSIIEYHRSVLDGGHPAVPEAWRRLSVTEAAVLQTFPAAVSWHRTVSATLRNIGNAVPPLLAQAVADTLRTALAGGTTERQDRTLAA
ncbi:DNA cytosine methyltransferase [Agrococcus sp. ProA11]|uniref:DNA cytosine methyltransferase n=1 Tax=Agrococcus chionoecetis TaxID=3153752 RepID=UPI0032619F91